MAFAPKFWKPGTSKPGASLELERPSQAEGSEGAGSCLSYNPNMNLSISKQKERLPIYKCRNQILYLLEKYRTVIIVGETGSGKTTQIPQYLLEAGWAGEGHVVGVTQPRRVAATTIAARVAEERGAVLGREVGYCIRFDDCSDKEATRIKFLTDGMLIREMMWDPLLKKYSVLMLDEAHERTLNTDIAVGLLKKIAKKREDLRIVISSATLDAELYKNFFETNSRSSSHPENDTAVIMTVEGRAYPVDIHYARQPVASYVTSTVETVLAIHRDGGPGDVLAFLTGQEEIEKAISEIREHVRISNKGLQLQVLPMYGGLPYSDQLQVFHRTAPNTRKVVVATNIAETSVTIPGIVYVVDCGFVKLRAFATSTGLETLVVVPTSQSSALQRSGRAGRVRSGKSYRLYTEESFHKLQPSTVPEMQRSNMAPVVLQLKALGVDNILRFNFLSPPPAEAMLQGLELLYALEAINDACELTDPLGLRMAEFPLNPMYARMLLVSDKFGCSEEILSIAAMLQVQHVFSQTTRSRGQAEAAKRMFCVHEGDHLTLLNVYRAFVRYNKNSRWCQENFLSYKALSHAVNIRERLKKLLVRFKVKLVSCDDDPIPVQRAIVSGFFSNAARLHFSGCFRTIRGDHSLHIHPSSVLYEQRSPQWVVFSEVFQTSKLLMRDITVIQPEWLYELAPHFYEFGTERERAEANVKRLKLDL